MSKKCINCGSELNADAIFCGSCGAKYTEPETPKNKKKHKRKGRWISLFLSFTLIVEFCLAGFWRPGFFNNDPTSDNERKRDKSKTVTSEDNTSNGNNAPDGITYNAAETASVSPENPVATFSNGISIDFGPEGLVSEEKISIKTADPIELDDEEGKLTVFDIQLGDNETIDLPMLVTVSLPLEEGTPEENVSIRCWDEELDTWVPIYSEVKDNHVLFYPEHFSCYSSFVAAGKLKSLSYYENQPLYKYISKTINSNTEVSLDEYALAARIKSKKKSTSEIMADSWYGKPNQKEVQLQLGLSAISSIADSNGKPVGVSLGGLSSISPETAGDVTDVISGGLVLLGLDNTPFASDIGVFGTALTIVQYFGSLYRNKGDILKTTQENWDSLAKLGAEYTLKRVGFSTGWLAVIYVAYLAGKKLSQEVQLAQHLGAKNDIEFAYRFFTMNYVFADCETGKSSVQYLPGAATNYKEATKLTADYLQKTEYRLLPIPKNVIEDTTTKIAIIRTGCELDWSSFLKNLTKANSKEGPTVLMNQIDKTINDYCNAFWKLKKSTKQQYLKEQAANFGTNKKLIEVWKEPTEYEKETMINEMKATIYAANKDLIKNLLDKSYVEMVNNVYWEAVRIEKQLNEKLTFTLQDSSGKNFTDDRFKNSEIKLRQFEYKGTDDFVFNDKNNYTVTCTRYAWIMTSRGGTYPQYVDIKGKNEKDNATFTFTFSDPNTIIPINFDDVTPETYELTLTKDYLSEDTSFSPNTVFADLISEYRPKGNTVSVKKDGTVEINLSTLMLSASIEGNDVTLTRNSIQLKGKITNDLDKKKQEGKFDIIPGITASHDQAGTSFGEGLVTWERPAIKETKTLTDVDPDSSGFILYYNSDGELEKVEISFNGAIETSTKLGEQMPDTGKLNTFGVMFVLEKNDERTYKASYNTNTSFDASKTTPNLRMPYEKLAKAYIDPDSPISDPTGIVSDNGEINLTQKLHMKWDPSDYTDYGEATIKVKITGKVDPATGEGTCTISGTGELTITDITGDQNIYWNLDITFSGDGTITIPSSDKGKALADWSNLNCKVEKTVFHFKGSASGTDELERPVDLYYDVDYTHNRGWSASIWW